MYIGPDHALNPERYFIVCIDQIGSGLSTSLHNADRPNAGISMSKFPKVRIGDDVVAQERLLPEHFGIESLQLVVGGSMGAQQTYEWAVRFPEKVLRAAPTAGTAQNTPHDFLYTETLNEAIGSDPGWNSGEYCSNKDVEAGLKRHAHIWGTMGFSTEFWKQEVWRALEFETMDELLEGFLEPYFTVMDPNDLLAMAWKWQRGDVTRHTGGDLETGLGRITAKTFVMPISEDMFFPPATASPSRRSSRAANCASSRTCWDIWVSSRSRRPTCPRSSSPSATFSPPRCDLPPATIAHQESAAHGTTGRIAGALVCSGWLGAIERICCHNTVR